MTASIRLVATKAERTAVYQFRYRIYVEEMHRKQRYADHTRKQIVDPLDETAFLVAAFDDDIVVGTQRLSVGNRGHFGEYASLYKMREFGQYWPERLSISSRLMVSPEYRRTTVPMQLAITCYKLALGAGVVFDFMDCNEHLVGYFGKLGFRQVFSRLIHPEYGEVVPMVLAGLDSEHLDRVGSPLRKHVPRIGSPDDSVLLFRSRFLESANLCEVSP